MLKTNYQRTKYYRLIHVGLKSLDWADDGAEYQGLLQRHGAKVVDGRYSKSTLTIGGLMAVVDDMKRHGFTPTKSKTSKASASSSDWRTARIAKITALWCALADAGIVRERGESAMVKWCARLTHKARLEWASSHDLNQCIAGLKDWAQREGVKLDG